MCRLTYLSIKTLTLAVEGCPSYFSRIILLCPYSRFDVLPSTSKENPSNIKHFYTPTNNDFISKINIKCKMIYVCQHYTGAYKRSLTAI